MPKRSIFSIEEDHSYCWVEWKDGAYWLYGNELGLIEGPCSTAAEAMLGNGMQHGSSFVRLETRLPEAEFRNILELEHVILWGNVDHVSVNDIESASTSVADLIAAYRASKRKERFRPFRPSR
jgi:hypothetical protein